MSKFYIKRLDGQIVAAPQHLIKTTVDAAGNVSHSIHEAGLKPGFSVATAVEWAAKKKGG